MPAADERRLAARAEFPVLARCVYLNSCSTGAFPRAMSRVLSDYWQTLAEWRDEAWERFWREIHAYADALAALIGAPPGSVWTDVNLSSLLGRLLGAIDFRERTKIVTTDREFPTVPFLLDAQRRRGVEMTVVAAGDGARVDEEAIVAAIDERTRLVCLAHASYATGALVDLAPIVRRAREVGALVAVDAYQTVGAVPIDVGALGVDFLLGGAHKWLCGSIETGFLYVRPSRTAELEPLATGWMASKDPLTFERATEYASSARRFAAGTPAVLPALLSQPGLQIISEIGVDAIRRASLVMTERILARADDAKLPVLTPRDPAKRGGVVSLRFPGDAQVIAALKERRFVASYRLGARIAPHFYNTLEEIDRFMDALIELAREASR